MKNILILITLLFIANSYAETTKSNRGGNAPGTETYPDPQNAEQTPSGVHEDHFEGDSLEIDTFKGKQRMENVDNTGDEATNKDQ